MKFFLAIVFVLVNGEPHILVSQTRFAREADCKASIEAFYNAIEESKKPDAFIGKCQLMLPEKNV